MKMHTANHRAIAKKNKQKHEQKKELQEAKNGDKIESYKKPNLKESKKRRKKEQRASGTKQNTYDKMVDLNSTRLIRTLNVNGLI